ncbi:hypothetical protein R1sor_008211 [Riccia sorocarpa]|uniref:Uncharacterized protein n=1 Tax=Riccia sorocarpa TaxID=122646 RepID=A0ABD3HSP8_9MARC
MCISFWLLDEHPAFWLVLAMNRDEEKARPSQPIHQWEDEEGCEIVGGRDEVGGGTWLGITKTGRLAFLTNFREAENLRPQGVQRKGVISRGALPREFFKSHKSPVAYLEEVAQNAHNYDGFNLVVADLNHREMAYLSNRPNGSALKVRKLTSGLQALSNGSLDSNWPKMERGRKKFEAILSSVQGDSLPNELIVEQVLQDRTPADDVSPQAAETEWPVELEEKLGSIFVDYPVLGRPYGTRSMSVIGIRRDGNVSFFERCLDEGGLWKDHFLQFPTQLQEKPKHPVAEGHIVQDGSERLNFVCKIS